MVFLLQFPSVIQIDIPFTASLNLVIQILLVLLLFSGGLILAKRKRLQLHGNIMKVAVIVGILTTLAIMLPSLKSIIEISSAFPSLAMASVVHGILGTVAGVVGLILFFKKFGTVKNWMRTVLLLWMITFLTGILVFSFYF